MPTLIRYQLENIISNLSSICPLNCTEYENRGTEHLFLCALGFEPRCLTLPQQLNEYGYKCSRSCYFKYSTNLDENAVNLPELERHLYGIASEVDQIDVDVPDFTTRFRKVLELIVTEAGSDIPKVTLDISAAANRLLLRSLKVLLEFDINLRIVYSEAAVYHPIEEEYRKYEASFDEVDHFGLERGVGEVVLSIDHPGDTLDPRPDSLILFPSLKRDRSQAVISFVDPSLLQNPDSKIVWLLGVPHLEEDRWRLDAMRRINKIDEQTRHFEVSTFDYQATLQCLENLHAELSKKNRITLSPLGSKMQALGTALFCYMHQDVRVILTSPREYNAEHYSEGCKGTWMVDFGHLSELRGQLDKVGTLKIKD